MVTHKDPLYPTGRGGVSAFLGPFVRNYLLQNGPSNPVDIHNAYKSLIDILVTKNGWPWRDSTFKSFMSWLRMSARLGLVERTDLTEPPRRDTMDPFVLTDLTFYQLTPIGRESEQPWISVRRTLYPEQPGIRAGYARSQRERIKDRKERIEAQGGIVYETPRAPRRRGRPPRVRPIEETQPFGEEELSRRERAELREREREPAPLTRAEEQEAEEAAQRLAEMAGQTPPPPARRGRRPRIETPLSSSDAAEAARQAEILRQLAEGQGPPITFG